jgi:hypothetical protein
LLHPTALVEDSYFPASQIFWDRLVQIGSNQLILPAIYGALKRKNLQHFVPDDLQTYLHEISDLNYNRNIAILKQIEFLTEIFNKHQIEHVFLKGAAMLIINPYDVKKERMIGDIDILVSERDLFKAQQLLINVGFELVSDEFSFTEDVLSEDYNKHLKRIEHPNHISAVEIHRRPLQNKTYLLDSKELLRNKVKSDNGYFTPSIKHLWKHAILNWQYNDRGMFLNFLAFRSVMDVLYLESKDFMIDLKFNSKAIKHFYSLLSLFYDNYNTFYPLKKLLYKLNLKSRTYFKSHLFLKKIIIVFVFYGFSRAGFFLKSKTYRRRVMNNPKLLFKRICFSLFNKKTN